MTTLSARKYYRRRVKKSACRGKPASICKRTSGCKATRRGKRKTYCRHNKNTRRGYRAKTNRYEVLGSSYGGTLSPIALSPSSQTGGVIGFNL